MSVLLLVLSLGTGCQTIRASLNFHSYVAVKVPGDDAQIPSEVVSTNGWKFVHLAACLYEKRTDQNEIVEDAPAQWYLAIKTKDGKPEHVPWLPTSRAYAKARKWLPEIADATKARFGVFPITLEVVNVLEPGREKQPLYNSDSPEHEQRDSTNRAAMIIGKGPHPSWPRGATNSADPMWHLGTNYSQLTAARKRVNEGHADGPWRVKVGIIDTGFSGTHEAAPRFLDESAPTNSSAPCQADAWNLISCALGEEGTNCRARLPSQTDGSHGTGTIGILAGRDVLITNHQGKLEYVYDGPLGGVPEATIVPVRVAPWVFSINTANFAYAIDYASRVKGCDVISMSHGGSPSLLWYNVINSAYWRGTALIAATGDFFSIGTYKRAATGIPPSWPVYPAAARRVLGVTGATADFKTYAAPTWGGYFRGLAHLKPFDSCERGSFGPDGSWRNTLGSDEEGDTIAANRNGGMRIHPIAAFSPNIPWAVSAPQTKSHDKINVVDLDGGGTSAATPQVAAAAALWLEYNRKDWTNLPAGQKWVKVEAVYQALLRTANRSRGNCWPHEQLGAGFLKADDALNRSFNDIVNAAPEYKFDRFQRSPRDFFDGDKSLKSIWKRLLGWTEPSGDITQKLLNQFAVPPAPDTPRREAIFRCFYNTRLLQAWHHGKTPDQADRDKMETEAWKDVAEAEKAVR